MTGSVPDDRVYSEFVFEVQALRRLVERDNHLGGALGVAAELWPHQVANVAYILGDTSVRHVIADEVGLGKTVQAIMVIKALRLQRPSLRIGILVPDSLQRQWVKEMLSRANLAVVEGEPAVGDDRRPTLLWPSAPGVEGVDLLQFSLLVVDELPRLTKALQEKVALACREVPHVLLLTATPPLDDLERAQQLFRIIEPMRAALAGDDVFAWLRRREAAVAGRLTSGWTDGSFNGPPPAPAEESAALAYATTRRLLRTRREAWRRYLPRRVAVPHLIEPTAAERRRQDLLWRWFRFRDDLPRSFDITALAQRVRSPASLRQRVTYLRGHGFDRDGLLADLSAMLDGHRGDSRFEALLDILSNIWSVASEAKVLIAAGDNLTVDDLAKRLPCVFDEMSGGTPLRVATIRNQTKGPDALVDPDDPIARAVQSFWEDVQVLILAESGTAGLNLQCARHIILYSIPWDPAEVEQLIGRVDRIGNVAADIGGEKAPIEVHVIGQRDLVDSRVLAVIKASRLLERSVSVDVNAVEEIRAKILETALLDEAETWSALEEEARALPDAVEAETLGLPLLEHLPTAPERAFARAEAIMWAPASAPAMGTPRPGAVGWSDALNAWLRGLRAAERYIVTLVDERLGVGRLRYNLPPGRVRDPAELPTRLLRGVLPKLGADAHFRLYRKHLEAQPRLYWGEKSELLYFLDHGSELHEDLVGAWGRTNAPGPDGHMCALSVDLGHPLADLRGRMVYLQVGRLDAASLLPPLERPSPELEADIRFVRQWLPSAVVVGAAVLDASGVAVLPDEVVHRLIAPPPDDPLLRPRILRRTQPSWLTPSAVKRARELAATTLAARARSQWEPCNAQLERAIAARRYVLAVERSELLERVERRRQQVLRDAGGREDVAERDLKRLAEALRGRLARIDPRDVYLQRAGGRDAAERVRLFTCAWLVFER